MADPLKEPLDIDELFKPYEKSVTQTKTDTEPTSLGTIVSSAYKEGRLGVPAGLLGAGAVGYGVKKAWDKSVQTSLTMLKEAVAKEQEAIQIARKANIPQRPVTLGRNLVGIAPTATATGAPLPTAEAEQLALARRITGSRWGTPLGLGGYAREILTPKIEITPQIYRMARHGEPTLGLTGMTQAEGSPVVVPASKVEELVVRPPFAPPRGGGELGPLEVAEQATRPSPNLYQRGARGLYNMHMGNAGIPLNSFGNVGTSLFKSGLGWGALAEGATSAYDMWPTWLGGSGNNVYGRARDEARAGGIDPNSFFNYDFMPAVAGGLANVQRLGYGAGNAITLGGLGFALEAMDIDKTVKRQTKEYEKSFASNPEKYDPDALEKVRLRMIASGMISPDSMQYNTRENTPEKVQAYKKKVEELKKQKK